MGAFAHRPRIAAAVVLLLFAATLATLAVTQASPARAAASTVSVDTLRTSWDPNEPGLSPSAVSASDFGQMFSTAVDGQVYAEPIVANGTLIVATENDNVYGIDPASGVIKWSRNVGPAWPAATIGCGDLVPNIGVTSTPVYDPTTGSVFFTSKVNNGASATTPHWYMHAVDPATGTERPGWPVTIQGSPANDPGHSFDPETAMQRPGLLLLGGAVYAGFASHCDHGPYVGYIVGVSTATPKLTTMWSTEAGSSNSEAGIWQSGGGLVSDGPGRIIVATGNGVSPPPGPGNAPPSTLAESVVRLAVNGNGTLTAQSFFSPTNNLVLDQDDSDLGSGGPMELPSNFGTPAHPHLVVQEGKDGRVFLLDADNLGGTGQAPGGKDAYVSVSGPYKGLWGSPGFWGGDGGYVYSVENGGFLRASHYAINGSGIPTLASVGTSTGTFGFGSGSPTITSTGTTSGSALVWVVHSPGPGQQAQLQAYDPVPVGGVVKLRYSAPIGPGTKFSRVAADNGRLYVGALDGHVLSFGRPTTAPITGTLTDFGTVSVGQTGTSSLTVTAARAVTISAVTAPPPFGVGGITLPARLNQGQQLQIPLTFSPTAPGASTASLTFSTDTGTTALGLQGRGTQPGLAADPTPLDFGTVATGSAKILTVNISNTGASSENVTAVSAPSAPFTAGGLPDLGSSIPAGGSVAVSVTYQPTAVGDQRASLTVTSDQGGVTLPLTGTAVSGAAILTVAPNPLNFGPVAVGTTATVAFTVSNTGNIGLTLKKAAPPTGVFNAPMPMSEGQFLSPGDQLTQQVTFTPTAAGAVSALYEITSDDGRGPQNLTITGTGVTDPIVAKQDQLAASGVQMGTPLGAEAAVGSGRYRAFSGGSIYWSQATGAHLIKGLILRHYLALGGPTGLLGFPITDELANDDAAGRHNDFGRNSGSIYWSPATGAFEIQGAIRSKWLALGGDISILGYPTTDEIRSATGAHNDFANLQGSIYWSSPTGAHVIRGGIRTKWLALGADRSFLGYATTDELDVLSGAHNDFTGGSIYYSRATDNHEIHGLIRAKWLLLGGVTSSYGYPASDQYAITGGQRENFQHGMLTLKGTTVT